MIDPYAGNPQFIEVRPRYLKKGNPYDLVINVLPDAPYDQTTQPFIARNKIFVGHSEDEDLAFSTTIHTLIFEDIAPVINDSRNIIYTRRPSSSYISSQLSSPHSLKLLSSKKHLNRELNTLGGKRKNTRKPKKKTRKPKKKTRKPKKKTQKKKTQKNRKK